jgi:hypothetical protein
MKLLLKEVAEEEDRVLVQGTLPELFERTKHSNSEEEERKVKKRSRGFREVLQRKSGCLSKKSKTT